MLAVAAPTLIIPLRTDDTGTIRVSGTRLTLDVLLGAYFQGRTPEQIHESFDVVSVEDVYAVIAYYLRHKDEIDTYLRVREKEAEELRREIEASYPPETKAWLARLKALADQKRAESGS